MVTVQELMQLSVKERASDIHLTVGLAPILRIYGELKQLIQFDQLTHTSIQEIFAPLLDEGRKKRLEEVGQVDFSYGVRGLARFRVNIFKQRGTYAGAMRLIPSEVVPLEMLGLPESVKQFTEKTRGLVLVTGPTGSGKSTSLASMIDIINTTRNCHIITLEDPIEFLHKHKRSIVNQREVGTDTDSFTNGLRAALREDPDVILVGEMRDFETIQIAITAAETGHLVFATLHTNDTVQTMDRIIDVFPPNQQSQVRSQLSLVILGVISQQLLPRIDQPGRVVATEIMVANSAIRSLVREGKTHQIRSSIQTGGKYGMQTLDSSLRTLYQRRIVNFQEAFMRAIDQDEFKKFHEQI
jgi:twitching motility protein PilT